VPTPPGLTDPAGAPLAKSSPPAIKADKWLAGLVLFVLVLAVAFYGIRALTRANPKPQAHTAAPIAPVAAQPAQDQSAPKLVDHPTSVEGKAVAKARDLVAAHDKWEKEQGVTAVLEEPTAPTTTPGPASASAAPAQADTASAAPAASQPGAPPEPSDAFKQFVVNMRVNGVFQGENARAMLNGKMYHQGDAVDVKLGISLFKIEVETKQIIFHDATGAVVSRHY
jgi:type IV secretory pathway VirB10-like protein